ncbi:MAG: recombinase family protein, partial [Chloroflexi bacterium]|nr:recombinase family protein [Chloroflexota bacterium]
LLEEIQAGRVQCVVVYRADRLSRRILDFLQLVELFDKHGVAFVSVTEQFNTSTPGGRLYQHMLLSFAQYERELIAERTRDKMHAARRKGRFVGGALILGYDRTPEGGRLVVNKGEAERVREIVRLFIGGSTLIGLARELNHRGWTLKRWKTKEGRFYGGGAFTKHNLRDLLANHTYVGKVNFGGTLYGGEHEAIVDQETWDKVQGMLAPRPRERRRPSTKVSAMLAGLLRCEPCGCAMSPSYAQKGRFRYRYYVCLRAHRQGWATCPSKSVSAKKIESFVVEQIRAIGRNPDLIARTVEAARVQLVQRKVALNAEAQRLQGELDLAHEAQRQQLGAVGSNGRLRGGAQAYQESTAQSLEEQLRAVEEELAALRGQRIHPDELRAALEAFDPVWAQLTTPERAQLLQNLIERIDYDGGTGRLAISFRQQGARLLGRDGLAAGEVRQ